MWRAATAAARTLCLHSDPTTFTKRSLCTNGTATALNATAAAPRRRVIETALLALADPLRAERRATFFKTAYSKDDTYIGVYKPDVRAVVRAHIGETTRAEVAALLLDRRHELRIAGGICLVEAFAAPLKRGQWLQESADDTAITPLSTLELKQRAVDMYLEHLAQFDNWDLVDLTSYKLLGAWMAQHARNAASIAQFCAVVDSSHDTAANAVDVTAELAQLTQAIQVLPSWYRQLLVSDDFWETRVSIVLVYGIRSTSVAFALHVLRYQLLRLLDAHETYELRLKGERFTDYDLVYKACGWMLRECGRTDRVALRTFLDRYAPLLPRTTLQYATEHLDPAVAKAIRSQGRRVPKPPSIKAST